MSRTRRVLRVCFADAEAFQQEYVSNLANGGVFVPSEEGFALRDSVRVQLHLEFCAKSVELEAEVVHLVTAEMAAVGGQTGVAVQFTGSAAEIRRRLEPLSRTCGILQFRPADPGRRASPRVRARVPIRIESGDVSYEGHTRDLSRTGVLVAMPGDGIEIGQYVDVTLQHPGTGETLEVGGTVVRKIETHGEVSAVGVQFDPPQHRRAEVERFVEEVQNVEHSRRLGGITGSIAELGPETLLQMLNQSSSAGTLTLRRGQQEGVIGFEGSILRYVHLGNAVGMKAFARLLGWQDGTFEFHAQLDALEASEAPLPLEAALLEGLRQLDEIGRIDPGRFPPEARVRVAVAAESGASEQPPVGKLEEAVLDLARAGFTVQRILDVIPEPDADIYRVLESLGQAGTIAVEA
ncbi:MAG: PilZ domain-containing protein [Myxococcales bacterium]|nr:PilZ domain-containing protein [Myxococcales bacterium]